MSEPEPSCADGTGSADAVVVEEGVAHGTAPEAAQVFELEHRYTRYSYIYIATLRC